MRFWRPDERFDPWKPGRNANHQPISIVSFHPTSEIPCFYHVSHNSFIWKVAMNTGTVSDPAGCFCSLEERNNSKLPIEITIFLKELPPVSNHHLYSIIWTLDFGVPPPSLLGFRWLATKEHRRLCPYPSVSHLALLWRSRCDRNGKEWLKKRFFLAEYLFQASNMFGFPCQVLALWVYDLI